MPSFEVTFIYSARNASTGRGQSEPHHFDARTRDEAKRTASEMIDSENAENRMVNVAILTTRVYGDALEVTRWVQDGGWVDAR